MTLKQQITIERAWVERLLHIADDINETRGTMDAPSRYSLQYLFGYIESLRSTLRDEDDGK